MSIEFTSESKFHHSKIYNNNNKKSIIPYQKKHTELYKKTAKNPQKNHKKISIIQIYKILTHFSSQRADVRKLFTDLSVADLTKKVSFD